MNEPHDRLGGIPDHDADPVAWDTTHRRFAAQGPPPDTRRVRVAAPPEGGVARPPARPTPVVVPPGEPPAARIAPGTPPPRQPAAPPDAPPRVRPSPGGPVPPGGTPGRRRPSVRRIALGVAVVLVLLVVGVLGYGWLQFRRIEKVDMGDTLARGPGTNYLIVGSDSREGVEADDPDAGAILGTTDAGQRSDTLLVLRVDGSGARMLSIPRDLFVTIADTGARQRINAAFQGGPQRLVRTITDQLGIPIHHYVEIDFVAFRDLVDAVGGITIDFPHPAVDTHSGLNVGGSGAVRLEGVGALAYVRSRHYTEIIDGERRPDPTGDIGRTKRQQQFLSAVMSEVGGTRNPFALVRISSALAGGMRVDDQLGYFGALSLARRMKGLSPQSASLPVAGFTTSAGAQVLRLVQPAADDVLAAFDSAGARTS